MPFEIQSPSRKMCQSKTPCYPWVLTKFLSFPEICNQSLFDFCSHFLTGSRLTEFVWHAILSMKGFCVLSLVRTTGNKRPWLVRDLLSGRAEDGCDYYCDFHRPQSGIGGIFFVKKD